MSAASQLLACSANSSFFLMLKNLLASKGRKTLPTAQTPFETMSIWRTTSTIKNKLQKVMVLSFNVIIMPHRGWINRAFVANKPLKRTEQTKTKHQASHGQLERANLTTNCSLVILQEDQRALSIGEERCVSVSQRNGMTWLSAQWEPLTSHHSNGWSVLLCQTQSCCQACLFLQMTSR